MTQPALTPYDTGERCEPKAWSTPTRLALQSLSPTARALDEDRFGKVDFENDEGATVVTVHVSRNDDGTHTVHVVPLVDDDELEVEVHSEKAP